MAGAAVIGVEAKGCSGGTVAQGDSGAGVGCTAGPRLSSAVWRSHSDDTVCGGGAVRGLLSGETDAAACAGVCTGHGGGGPAWAAMARRVQAEEAAREDAIARIKSWVDEALRGLSARIDAVHLLAHTVVKSASAAAGLPAADGGPDGGPDGIVAAAMAEVPLLSSSASALADAEPPRMGSMKQLAWLRCDLARLREKHAEHEEGVNKLAAKCEEMMIHQAAEARSGEEVLSTMTRRFEEFLDKHSQQVGTVTADFGELGRELGARLSVVELEQGRFGEFLNDPLAYMPELLAMQRGTVGHISGESLGSCSLLKTLDLTMTPAASPPPCAAPAAGGLPPQLPAQRAGATTECFPPQMASLQTASLQSTSPQGQHGVWLPWVRGKGHSETAAVPPLAAAVQPPGGPRPGLIHLEGGGPHMGSGGGPSGGPLPSSSGGASSSCSLQRRVAVVAPPPLPPGITTLSATLMTTTTAPLSTAVSAPTLALEPREPQAAACVVEGASSAATALPRSVTPAASVVAATTRSRSPASCSGSSVTGGGASCYPPTPPSLISHREPLLAAGHGAHELGTTVASGDTRPPGQASPRASPKPPLSGRRLLAERRLMHSRSSSQLPSCTTSVASAATGLGGRGSGVSRGLSKRRGGGDA